MEITSFILGVCAVIVLAMVVGTFVNYMSLKTLKQQLDNFERDIYQQVDLTNPFSLIFHLVIYVDQNYLHLAVDHQSLVDCNFFFG